MMESVKVRIGWLNNYCAASEEILGCVATSDSLDGVKQAYAEALRAHIDGMIEDGDDVPLKLQGDYQLDFELELSAILHSLDGVVTRKAIAKQSGVNEVLITHYANGFRKPRQKQRDKIVMAIKEIGDRLSKVG